ncbi:MAG: hypothetical protein KME13_02360 [Myxacorys californica WJT36-NPBG1]|nr:hypothetical protein [Myxacorys californica WJT36-NPBG1]
MSDQTGIMADQIEAIADQTGTMPDQTGIMADQIETAIHQHEFFSSLSRREIENLSPLLVEPRSFGRA